mmetsp:Transcript_144538/g.402749  ORF Transcript_144538/g.402749 Transcript_144538/m.402749 type:complete len:785 (-) Transcript_144538:53-2407(-)
MATDSPGSQSFTTARAVEPEDWDPLSASAAQLQRRPSTASLRRLRSELAGLRAEPLPGVQVCPDEEAATLVHALVSGPPDTPYAGGLFHFALDAPDNYPHSPPRARLLTTGGGTVRFNPQFYASGKVCLSILHTWPGPGWQPTFTLRVVLLQLQALMNEMPALNEPGMMLMSHPEEYNDFLRHETLRVAVLGIADEALTVLRAEREGSTISGDHASSSSIADAEQRPPLPWLPASLAHAVLEHIAEHAKELEARCRAAAKVVPENSVLRGLPQPTRAKYLTMAAAFHALQPSALNDSGDGSPSGKVLGLAAEEEPRALRAAAAPLAAATQSCSAPPLLSSSGPESATDSPDGVEGGSGGGELEECRICGGGRSEGELLRICGCAGSMALVHRHCAAEWIRRDGSPICPVCRKVYSDPALYSLGALGRCQRSCAGICHGMRLCMVLIGCFLFNKATGGGLRPVEVSRRHLRRWRVQPALEGASEAQYQLRGRHLMPARSMLDRWRSPLVEDVVVSAQTPWSEKPVPVPLRFEMLARLHGQQRWGATSLASLLSRWRRDVIMRQAKRRVGILEQLQDALQGRVRCVLHSMLEPLPSLTLRLSPTCAARVSAAAVLFAWLAVGKRTWIWLFMCCHLGFRFAPAPLVGATTVGAHLAAHQVQRRLARQGMLRRRPELEADLLLISLLLLGALCAGGIASGESPDKESAAPERPPSAAVTAVAWVMLFAVGLSIMATIAHPPEGRQGVCPFGAGLLHGLLWSLCGSLLCLVVAAPVLSPGLLPDVAHDL